MFDRWVDARQGMLTDEFRRDDRSDRARRRRALAPLKLNSESARAAGYCPVIYKFLRTWSRSLSPGEQDALLVPLVDRLRGSNHPAVEKRRAFMALDWVVRVQVPGWRLALDAVKNVEQFEKTSTLRVYDPIPAIMSLEQLPSVERSLYELLGRRGIGPQLTVQWELMTSRRDPAEAAKQHFRAATWRRIERILDSSAYWPAMSAANVAFRQNEHFQKINSWSQMLVQSDAAQAVEAKLWMHTHEALKSFAEVSNRAKLRADLFHRKAVQLWRTEAPRAWEEREYIAWLACLALSAISAFSAARSNRTSSLSRQIAIAVAQERGAMTDHALRQTIDCMQKSAFVLANNMMEISP